MPPQVIYGKEYKRQYTVGDEKKDFLTLADYGGGVTSYGKNGNPTITMMQEPINESSTNSGPVNADGVRLSNPNWLVAYHEGGGHAYCRAVCGDVNQRGKTVDYENLIRSLHGLELRAYDTSHPNPSPEPKKPNK
jgi:hypothetical protein